jgi:hypothetical protein
VIISGNMDKDKREELECGDLVRGRIFIITGRV